MDPCRRVLGTVRDYIPFGGSMGGLFGQFGAAEVANSIDVRGNLGQRSVSYAQSDTSVLYGYLPRVTTTPYRAPSYFTVRETTITANPAIGNATTRQAIETHMSDKPINSYINGYACIGSSLASANSRLGAEYFGNGTGGGFNLPFRPYGVAAMSGNWTIGRSYVQQFTGSGAASYFQATEESSIVLPYEGGNKSTFTPQFSGMNSSFANPTGGGTTITSDQVRSPLISATADGATVLSQFTVGAYPNLNTTGGGAFLTTSMMPQADVTTEFHIAGIPLPQYFLSNTPWLAKNFAYAKNAENQFNFWGASTGVLGSERIACFGTYLTSSIPQSRRVLSASQTGNGGSTTYIMSNIEFVSQQIILPDSVSASILEDAAQGDISLNSNSIHNYQTPCGISTSQNLIIPAKIASANTMYCMFVPQAFVSGNAASLYNSLRGVNPFAAVAATNLSSVSAVSNYTDANVLGLDGGNVSVRNTPCRSGAFQIQLKIGNELIPQQPLTTVTELVSENVKAQHKLFDTQSNVNTLFSITTTEAEVLGGEIVSGLAYDSLKSGEFMTTFISADLLDDQTALNNPAMGYVYACEANRQIGSGQQASAISSYLIPRSRYTMPIFQPPESSFVIAFDLDTWSRFSDVTRSGKYLGNNTITLTMQQALALGLTNQQSGSNGYILQTFIVHDIRFSFQAGGSVVSYY